MFGIEQGVFDVVHCWGLGQGGFFCLLGNGGVSDAAMYWLTARPLSRICAHALFSSNYPLMIWFAL